MPDRVLLDLVRVAVSQSLSRETVAAVRAAEQYHHLDHAARRLVSTLHTTLVGREFAVETEAVRWPDGWWQALKAAHAPGWFLRWRPVRYAERRVVARVTKVCPHLAVPPHDPRHVEYLVDRPTPAEVAGGP